MAFELLDLTSEMDFSDAGESQEAASVSVKGFASVEMLDREGEIASPLEFDIETFMNSPTLLENHKFLRDEFGNEVASGKVTSAAPAILRDIGDDANWGIEDIRSGEQINVYPKTKVPRLKAGSRGLFVTAEVTHPFSLKKVISGELGGLSWRGFSLNEKRGGTTRLKQIDLFEISLVNIPAVSQATFVVGKSVNDKSSWQTFDKNAVRIFRLRFEKSRFGNAELVSKYLETHSLGSLEISETSDHYFAALPRPGALDIEKSFAIPMGGVQAIVAPVKDEDMTSVAEFVGHIKTNPVKRDSKMPEKAPVEKSVQKLYLLDDSLLAQFPKSKVALQKSADLEDGTKLEVYSYEFVPNEGLKAAVETATETTVEPKVEAKTEEAPKQNEELAALLKQMQELKDAVAALKKSDEKTPEQKTQDEVSAMKEQIEQAQAAAQESQKKLDMALAAYNRLVPEQPTRSESLKSVKSEKNETKKIGDIFASVLPFEG